MLDTIERQPHRKKRRRRVLLAEDDAGARALLARVLEGLGLDVVQAQDGGRLLVAITSYYKNQHRPDEIDLVITDVQMPVLSGLEVIKGLSAAHWHTPVIVMTAHTSADLLNTVETVGGVLLTKPLDLDTFEAVVVSLLREDDHAQATSR